MLAGRKWLMGWVRWARMEWDAMGNNREMAGNYK